MSNSANNTMMNREQMIEKIQKRLDEIGVERFFLNPYKWNENDNSEIWFSKAKRDTLEKYVIENLADPDYFEYTDWWDEYITAIPNEVFTDPDRYPYLSNKLRVDWDEYNPIVNYDTSTELTEISFGNIKGCITEGASGAELYFRDPLNIGNIIFSRISMWWTNFDEILEYVWELVNDSKMIKFNELANKPDVYFENMNK